MIHRWDLGTSKELPPLEKHVVNVFSTVSGCHYLPDNKTVISVGVDGMIRRWDAATAKEHTDRTCYAGNACAAPSPDGRWTAVGDGSGRVDLWDTRTGKLISNLRSDGPTIINKLAFAPDSKALAVGFRPGSVTLYDVPSGRETKLLPWDSVKNNSGHEPYLNVLLFSPDGRSLYVNDYMTEGRLWNVATGEVIWRGGPQHTAAWTPDGKAILVHRAGPYVTLLDATDGKALSKVGVGYKGGENLGGIVPSLAFSPDGRQLAMSLRDGTLSLCDAKTLKERKRIKTVGPPKNPDDAMEKILTSRLSSGAVCLAYSADSKWLISGDRWGALVCAMQSLALRCCDWKDMRGPTAGP